MDAATLKLALDDWNAFYRDSRQALLARIPSTTLPDKNIASALIGVRRSGKTSHAILCTTTLAEDSVLYFNFEDPLFLLDNQVSNLDLLLSVAEQYSKVQIKFLILDEIQNVSGWERWLRKIVDLKRYQVIITGSSAKLLSSEISTSITGRCLEHYIWPLSFKEYLQFRNITPKRSSDLLRELRSYSVYGGFPEVVLSQLEARKKDILRQYLGDITNKDIVSRNEIRNKRALDQIIAYYLTNLSSLHSFTAVAKAFQIDTETASLYSLALEDAFLMFSVERYHRNMKVQARDPRKVYTIDPGFRTVGARSREEDLGKLLENIVFIELKRRRKQVQYWKGKAETDFIVVDRYKPLEALQVCASNLEEPRTRSRELNGLIECLEELKLHSGTIISWDREEIIKESGKRIEIIPAYKWLLGQ